jgi:NTP pyrophosphatase (non-canonical NTP hydrolase)
VDLDEYQAAAAKYDLACATVGELWYYALGLCGESGEVAEKIKKHYRGDAPLDLAVVTKELGDVLWYVAALSRHLGLKLDAVAGANIEKLEDRLRRGAVFGSGDSR